jgi:hypothetical protein
MNAYAAALQRRKSRVTRQLEILSVRSFELADRVKAGELELLDGVDVALSAAEWSGLIESVGNDVVQTVLHEAFIGARVSTGHSKWKR